MGNKVTKVYVTPVGRKFSRPYQLDERVARHLIRQGKVKLVEDQPAAAAQHAAAMEQRGRAVIERAPEPAPLVLETKQGGSEEPAVPSFERREPVEPEPAESDEDPEPPEPESAPEPDQEEEEVVVEVDEDAPPSKSRRRAAAAEAGAAKARRRS